MLFCSEIDKIKLLFIPQVAQAQFVNFIIALLKSDKLQVQTKHVLANK